MKLRIIYIGIKQVLTPCRWLGQRNMHLDVLVKFHTSSQWYMNIFLFLSVYLFIYEVRGLLLEVIIITKFNLWRLFFI